MATTLTYGRKVPVDGDQGDTVYDAIEGNIALDDAHTHDGTTSAALSSGAISNTTQSIAKGSWVASGSYGLYRQLIAITGGLEFDSTGIQFRDQATDEVMYLHVEKQATSAYYVYINDNSIDLTAVYL